VKFWRLLELDFSEAGFPSCPNQQYQFKTPKNSFAMPAYPSGVRLVTARAVVLVSGLSRADVNIWRHTLVLTHTSHTNTYTRHLRISGTNI